ncbi:Type III effector HopPmaJ [Methylophaga frappieri]|uniref:Type III effector HopPmaJ n=2 Tax=Methylophaga frappieri (strain ATCC BAA-2434 / DSM 25690 / JAM7) TaxID=754477 RepID=I1YIK9_METFJ|nr:HopJ type III effector protein [Methylophaga frappieri]AFJ02752.1 Type III effector HopPmaJ [Methylophaga frappieri]
MELTTYLSLLETQPERIRFTDTMAVIDANYDFTPTAFKNAGLENQAGENNGSCKIFAFGLLQDLNEAQTLACFGDYYRKEVLLQPQGSDHQNIRHFLKHGWDGISFAAEPLTKK